MGFASSMSEAVQSARCHWMLQGFLNPSDCSGLPASYMLGRPAAATATAHQSTRDNRHSPSVRKCRLSTPMPLLISRMSLVDILVMPTAIACSLPSA